MPNITKIEWDFGNGLKSNSAKPITVYTSGIYTVTMKYWLDDGTQGEETKTVYVEVGEDGNKLDDREYTDNPFSLHYGWNDDMGLAWNINQRKSMPTPTTFNSVYTYEQEGVPYTIVWDFLSGKPYIYEALDDSRIDAVYKDKVPLKVNTDGNEYYDLYEGIDIETEIITPEFTGEMMKYRLNHIESNTMFRPEREHSDYLGGFNVAFGLIVDNDTEPVETKYKADYDKEVLFYYQSQNVPLSRTRSIKLNTTTSRYQMLAYEGFFKQIDEFTALANEPDYSMEAQAVMGNVVNWITVAREYSKDLASKQDVSNTLVGSMVSADFWIGSFQPIYVTSVSTITISEEAVAATMWVYEDDADSPVFDYSGWSIYDKIVSGAGELRLIYRDVQTDGLTINIPEALYIGDIRGLKETPTDGVLFEYFNKTSEYIPC